MHFSWQTVHCSVLLRMKGSPLTPHQLHYQLNVRERLVAPPCVLQALDEDGMKTRRVKVCEIRSGYVMPLGANLILHFLKAQFVLFIRKIQSNVKILTNTPNEKMRSVYSAGNSIYRLFSFYGIGASQRRWQIKFPTKPHKFFNFKKHLTKLSETRQKRATRHC